MTIENCEKFFSAYTEAERAALVQLIYFSEKLFQERSEIRKRCQARLYFNQSEPLISFPSRFQQGPDSDWLLS